MEAPNPILTEQEISQTIFIFQDSTKYPLYLSSTGDIIIFSLEYGSSKYSKKTSIKEIKDKESNAVFSPYKSKDFFEFFKSLAEEKKISLIKKDNTVIIKFELQIMIKKHEIEIELISKDKNIELMEKELQELKVNYNKINEENKDLRKRIEILEAEIKEIKKVINPDNNIKRLPMDNKSVIIQENEFDLIRLGIKNRLKKEVKGLKKLYRALIDGDDVNIFHSKCDNIPNTLVLIKSIGNRRFGGFTTIPWSSPDIPKDKDDPNAFLFSLDKQRIYPQKQKKTVIHYKTYGPCFGNNSVYELYIGQHCIETKYLYTNESKQQCSIDYGEDKNALSESGNGQCTYAADYEVFQVIF